MTIVVDDDYDGPRCQSVCWHGRCGVPVQEEGETCNEHALEDHLYDRYDREGERV